MKTLWKNEEFSWHTLYKIIISQDSEKRDHPRSIDGFEIASLSERPGRTCIGGGGGGRKKNTVTVFLRNSTRVPPGRVEVSLLSGNIRPIISHAGRHFDVAGNFCSPSRFRVRTSLIVLSHSLSVFKWFARARAHTHTWDARVGGAGNNFAKFCRAMKVARTSSSSGEWERQGGCETSGTRTRATGGRIVVSLFSNRISMSEWVSIGCVRYVPADTYPSV